MPGLSVSEYSRFDAVDLAALIRDRQVSAAEALGAAQEAARLRKDFNALAHTFSSPIAEPDLRPEMPFPGVPFLAKDIGLQLRGTPLTLGSAAFAGSPCPADDTLASRYLKAGLAIFGRTTMAEMGLGILTASKTYGSARNPWMPARNAGGSSGGSAVAVAAGIVPFAHATDAFGSIRIPAAHCGLFGLKPSRMRIPLGPGIAEALAGLSSVHCVSRSVRDSARLLDAVQGPDIGDPYAAFPDQGTFASALEAPPPRLRIAFSADAPNGTPVDEAIRDAVTAMANHLVGLGHILVETAMPYDADQLRHIIRVIAGTTALSAVRARLPNRSDADLNLLFEPATADWIRLAREFSAAEYLETVQSVHRMGRQIGQFLYDFDVFLSPVTAQLPLPADRPSPPTAAALIDEIFRHAPFTGIYNVSGGPAMTVPAGQSAEGLPIGVQLGAAAGKEWLLFALAGEIEKSRPWPKLPNTLSG